MTSFFINNTVPRTGPGNFARNLTLELCDLGLSFTRFGCDVNIINAYGKPSPFSKQLARFDGLYFDAVNSVYDSEDKNKLLKSVFYGVDGIIFQSHFNYKQYKHKFGVANVPTSIIMNGAGREFYPGQGRLDLGDKKNICCAANWRAHKRLSQTIDAFALLPASDFRLFVVGGDPDNNLHSPENIVFTGSLSASHFSELLRNMDAFVHLSWLDSCPNVVVEALRCGVPIVSSNQGGTRELVKNNGLILELDAPYEFNDVDLYNPPIVDLELVAQAIREVCETRYQIDTDYYSISRAAKQYKAVMESLIG